MPWSATIARKIFREIVVKNVKNIPQRIIYYKTIRAKKRTIFAGSYKQTNKQHTHTLTAICHIHTFRLAVVECYHSPPRTIIFIFSTLSQWIEEWAEHSTQPSHRNERMNDEKQHHHPLEVYAMPFDIRCLNKWVRISDCNKHFPNSNHIEWEKKHQLFHRIAECDPGKSAKQSLHWNCQQFEDVRT